MFGGADFVSGLDSPLLHLSKNDPFTLRHLFAGGVQVFGSPGSGKTSGSGRTLAVLKHADTLADLPFYRRIAMAMGESTETVVTVLGKNSKTAFRAYRAGRHVKAAIGGSVAALLASLGGILLSLSGSMTTAIVKRMTRHLLTSA